MSRAYVFQKLQLGKEVTPGTVVAADKILQATSFRPRPMTPADRFRPVGSIFHTDLLQQKEWTEGDIEGTLAYNDFIYLAHMCIEDPGDSVYTYKPDGWGTNPVQTFTADYGDATDAERFAHMVVTSLGVRFTRTACEVRGSFLGKKMTEGVVITPTPTKVNKVVAAPKKTRIEVADSVAGLAAGKLTRCLEAGFSFGDRFTGLFPLDEAEDSFTDIVEQGVDFGGQIILEHNSVSRGLMADLRSSKQKFARFIHDSGVEYGVGTTYKIQVTFPFKFEESDRGEQQGVLGATYNLMPNYEATFDSGIEIVVGTDLASI